MTTTQRPYDGYAPFDDDLTDYARPQDYTARWRPRGSGAAVLWLAAVPGLVALIVWAVGR